ncbi:MAG: PLP-dependent aminotransferase family protein [Actinobacteria bacterium]|nr:PLP-dependent aminotransferase family protein [Actinomycetota bacterium]MDI6830764.1 PLP-dependent aminotransferase family protein [Actinomycetota bacterium]
MSPRFALDPFEGKYAHRTSSMLSSEIRDLLSVTARPDIISLAGGLPFTQALDAETILRTVRGVLEDDCAAALQYGPTDGYAPLKRDLMAIMAAEGTPCFPEDIMITNGAQQGLELIAKIFINPGDNIITEAPSYVGALNSFLSYQPCIHSIPLDGQGLRTDLLEEKLVELARQDRRAKFIYVVPNFQNPAGITMSRERRFRLLELAHEHDCLVVEDNPYGLLRFEGEPEPSLRSLDEGRVVYLGTLSKIFAAGMRIGWVAAPHPILDKLLLAKQSADLCSSTFVQMVAHRYLSSEDWRGQVERLREIYRGRRDAMLEALHEHLEGIARWTNPQGGLFVWVTLPEFIKASEMLAAAIDARVAFVPGTGFFPYRGGESCMRLNFSYADEETIHEGIKRLARVIKHELSLARALGYAVALPPEEEAGGLTGG